MEISDKLDKMLRLLSIVVVKGIEKEQDKIGLLNELGFKPIEIARLLNKSPENVRVQLGIVRKGKKVTTEPKEAEQAQIPKSGEKDAVGVVTSNLSKPEDD